MLCTKRLVELLEFVTTDWRVIDAYPHETSGVSRQRVLLALSLLLNPPGADSRRTDHRARYHHAAQLSSCCRLKEIGTSP